MNYQITKIKLQILDTISSLSAKTFDWSKGNSNIIRLGIHENEDTKEIKIKDMKKTWNDLTRRMKKCEPCPPTVATSESMLENIRSNDISKIEVDSDRLKKIEEYTKGKM